MLRTRIVTAAVLLAVLLPALFFLPQAGWGAFVAIIVGVGAWEWGAFMQAGPHLRVGLGLVLSAMCLALLAFFPQWFGALGHSFAPFGSIALHAPAAVFWLLLVPFWLRCKWRLTGVPGVMVGFLVLLPAWAALVQLRTLGPWPLLAILALVWVADSAAYFFGSHFGKHKLAINISPGKTWEGAIGAAVTVLIYGLIMRQAFGLYHSPLWLWLFGLPVMTALSIIGDLFESLLKRQASLKDSSTILPGHGGVLDRIDSQTSTLPLLMMVLIL